MKLTIALIVTRLAFANGQPIQALFCTSESAFLSDTFAVNYIGDALTCSDVAEYLVSYPQKCSEISFDLKTTYRDFQSTCCGGAEYIGEIFCPDGDDSVDSVREECSGDSPCLEGFCNYGYGSSGSCEDCPEIPCINAGLDVLVAVDDCQAVCKEGPKTFLVSKDEICTRCESSYINSRGVTQDCYDIFFELGFPLLNLLCNDDYYYGNDWVSARCKEDVFGYVGCSYADFAIPEGTHSSAPSMVMKGSGLVSAVVAFVFL